MLPKQLVFSFLGKIHKNMNKIIRETVMEKTISLFEKYILTFLWNLCKVL